MNQKIFDLLEAATNKLEATRDCTRCNATGKLEFFGKQERCNYCRGLAFYVRPDLAGIYATLFKKGPFRASRPKDERTNSSDRLYYVWRIARFDGGQDVTMPIMAETGSHGDPYIKELGALASICAKLAFGTDMAAALRWGALLGIGGLTEAQASEYMKKHPQPMTANASGPVLLDHNKPQSERLELEQSGE